MKAAFSWWSGSCCSSADAAISSGSSSYSTKLPAFVVAGAKIDWCWPIVTTESLAPANKTVGLNMSEETDELNISLGSKSDGVTTRIPFSRVKNSGVFWKQFPMRITSSRTWNSIFSTSSVGLLPSLPPIVAADPPAPFNATGKILRSLYTYAMLRLAMKRKSISSASRSEL
uniref:Putative secreted protein n=1 Tax=Anopheles darlingi TaxID=43151 RepID=A0A2M4DHI9_ANODA